MKCQDTESCFKEIRTYFNNMSTGFPLVVDTEDYDSFHLFVTWLRSDPTKQFIYVSDFCAEDGLPRVQEAYAKAFEARDNVLVGLSQACMLQSTEFLWTMLDSLLDEKTMAHTVVLLMHCRDYLLRRCRMDVRLERRIVLLEGSSMPLPQILLVQGEEDSRRANRNIKELLVTLEQMSNEDMRRSQTISVITKYPLSLFLRSPYGVKKGPGFYERICRDYADLADGSSIDFGTDEQWKWLWNQLQGKRSFSELVTQRFRGCESLDSRIADILSRGTDEERWLYWLSAKIYRSHNQYFNAAVQAAGHYMDLERAIYFVLLEMDKNAKDFPMLYQERKCLLEKMPENMKLLSQYCNEVGKKDIDAVYFLTDRSELEQFKLVKCLSDYTYGRDEVRKILQQVSPELYKYMEPFVFSAMNTNVSDESLLSRLTKYFDDYKWQKLLNNVEDEFLSAVEKNSHERPYNRLLCRTAVIKNMDCREAQPYFLDALGVEYLSYLREKCKEYGLIAEINIAHAELPTITELNKDFEASFSMSYVDIKDLDELKHGGNRFNYERVKEPIHIVYELKAIDRVLRRIQSDLLQGMCKRGRVSLAPIRG